MNFNSLKKLYSRNRKFIVRSVATLGGLNAAVFILILNPENPVNEWVWADAGKMFFIVMFLFVIFYFTTLYFVCVLLTSTLQERIIVFLMIIGCTCGLLGSYYPLSYSISMLTAIGTALFSKMRNEMAENFPTIDRIMG